MAKILLVANVGFTISNFRREFVQSLIASGHEVKIVCPTESDFNNKLSELSVDVIDLPLCRKGINPLKDFKTLRYLTNVFKVEQPDIVLNYTIKPVIYSSIAARISKVPKVCSFITGLGYTFTHNNPKTRVIRSIVIFLYKLALRRNHRVFFQNPDDLAIFKKFRLVPTGSTKIINGSGVNLDKFFVDDSNKIKNSFAFVGRLLKDKGINEFVEAAKVLKSKYEDATFWICGSTDNNPMSLSDEDVKKLEEQGSIKYLSYTDDIKSFLEDKEVFVLHSYRDGTPRSLLEAMAMKMPIITTDAPGCRETTIDGKNGFLVKVKSSSELVEAMSKFLEKPELKELMGTESYKIATTKYDVRKVNQSIFEGIGI
jgi:glycosyltransferase involved in cell wall biosynthesis